MTTSGTINDIEWYSEWQQMTTSDKSSDQEWQRKTTSDNKWQRVVTNDIEWQRMTGSGMTNELIWGQIK